MAGQIDAINARARNLVEAWRAQNPFALQTSRRWGSPLRHVDLWELRFRKRYVAQALIAIPEWAANNAGSTYAGLYVDERKGGIIEVGFVGDQVSQLATLLSSTSLLAPDRITGLPIQPTHSLVELEDLRDSIVAKGWSMHGSNPLMSSSIDVLENRVKIVTRNVAFVAAHVLQEFGQDTPVTIVSPRDRRLVPR